MSETQLLAACMDTDGSTEEDDTKSARIDLREARSMSHVQVLNIYLRREPVNPKEAQGFIRWSPKGHLLINLQHRSEAIKNAFHTFLLRRTMAVRYSLLVTTLEFATTFWKRNNIHEFLDHLQHKLATGSFTTRCVLEVIASSLFGKAHMELFDLTRIEEDTIQLDLKCDTYMQTDSTFVQEQEALQKIAAIKIANFMRCIGGRPRPGEGMFCYMIGQHELKLSSSPHLPAFTPADEIERGTPCTYGEAVNRLNLDIEVREQDATNTAKLLQEIYAR
jgi:hypothetical protein